MDRTKIALFLASDGVPWEVATLCDEATTERYRDPARFMHDPAKPA